MTATQHTQIDFTLKEFGEKIRRVQIKLQIAYRNEDVLSFPTSARQEAKTPQVFFLLPSDEQIRKPMTKHVKVSKSNKTWN